MRMLTRRNMRTLTALLFTSSLGATIVLSGCGGGGGGGSSSTGSSAGTSSGTNAGQTGPTFALTDLGTLPGKATSNGISMNQSRQLVGVSGNDGSDSLATLWDNGTLTSLGKLPGHVSSIAYSVNATGVAVGASYSVFTSDTQQYVPVIYQNGTVTQLPIPSGGTRASATSINDSGDIIISGRLYKGGAFTTFTNGFIAGTFAQSLNNADQIVGSADAAGVRVPALWQNGVVTNLGTSPGVALVVNANAQVAGTLNGASSQLFLYSAGTTSTFSPLTGDDGVTPKGINNLGTVVGVSSRANASTAFMLYQNKMYDLNTQIKPAVSGWVLTDASGIDDSGRIIGTGTLNGVTRSFLLTPNP